MRPGRVGGTASGERTKHQATGIDLNIGDDHSNREWNGWLDDIRIYDEALSPGAIAALAGVPEPSSALLLCIGGLALLRRRRN